MSLDYFSQTYRCDDCDEPTARFIKTSAIRRCPSCHAKWRQSLAPPKPVVVPPPSPVIVAPPAAVKPAPVVVTPTAEPSVKPPPPQKTPPTLCRWPGCPRKGDSVKRAGFCPACHSRLWRAGKAPCSLKEGEIISFAQAWKNKKPVRKGCQWPGCSKLGPWCTTHFSRFRLRGVKPGDLSEADRQQFMATWTGKNHADPPPA